MVSKSIAKGLGDLFPGSSIPHFEPFSLFTVELHKPSPRAAFSDLLHKTLDELCLGLLGGLSRGIGCQHGLNNAGQAQVAAVFVANFAASDDNVEVTGGEFTPKVGDVTIGTRHDDDGFWLPVGERWLVDLC